MMQYLKCVLLTVCFIFPLIPIVRGNGDRAIVSAKLISVFPYDLYSVFNNCNTALSGKFPFPVVFF